MKKIILIVAVVLATFFILFPKIHSLTSPTVITTKVAPSVSVVLDNGSTVATTSGVTAQNAFQALQEATKKQHLELKTKQYDFGVFVEEIGTIANSKEKSWIFFVNGKAGTVAADKQNVNTGDTVEWKYIAPTIE